MLRRNNGNTYYLNILGENSKISPLLFMALLPSFAQKNKSSTSLVGFPMKLISPQINLSTSPTNFKKTIGNSMWISPTKVLSKTPVSANQSSILSAQNSLSPTTKPKMAIFS